MNGPTLKYKPYLSCKGCDFLYDIRKPEDFKVFSRPKYYCYTLHKISTYPVTPKWCPLKKKNMLNKLIREGRTKQDGN